MRDLLCYTIKRHKWIVGIALTAGILGALIDGLSIGMFLPILESVGGEGAGGITQDSPIAFLAPYFANLTPAGKIQAAAIGLALIALLKGVFEYINRWLSYKLQIAVERGLRLAVFDHLAEVEIGYIYRQKTANLIVTLDAYTLRTSNMAQILLAQAIHLFVILVYLGWLVILSWQLTILTLIFSLAISWMFKSITSRARALGDKLKEEMIQLYAEGLEFLAGIKVVKLFAREDHMRQRFERALCTLQETRLDVGKVESLIRPAFVTTNIFMFSLLLIAGSLLMPGSVDAWIELTVLFIVILLRVTDPLGALNRARVSVASNEPSIRALFDFLQRGDKTFLPDGNIPFISLENEVVFDKVTFCYDPKEGQVLQEVSLEVPKGKTTAIVGASGSGKSTLVDSLARLHDPQDGRILVDGTDLREFNVQSWRRSIAVVSQDTFLFNDTVRNNIAFGKLDATDEEIVEAARLANADEFITEFADGYDTLLGERGVRLSGGQRQRIAIARAILANPQLLIFDEATSALDSKAEREVQQAIEQISKERTVLTIAHRLSTIQEADNIVVLDKGRVVEQGTHEELVALGGRYYGFVKLQELGDASRELGAVSDL